MKAIVNIRQQILVPVQANFSWSPLGPKETYTYEGDTFPYTSPEPAARYIAYTTPLKLPITFDAIDSKKEGKAKTIVPPGVVILEYFWDFGDGIQGYGPVVNHTYHVLDPDIYVKLTVIDSRSRRWSVAQPLNLIALALARLRPFVIAGTNLETTRPRLKLERSVTDQAISVDKITETHSPHATDSATDKLASTDHVSLNVSLVRSAFDTAVATDALTRGTNTARSTTDKAIASDSASRTTLTARTATDTAASTETTAGVVLFKLKSFQAALAFKGKSPH